MKSLLLLYIFLISLNISYQLNCFEFNSGTCGFFNEDYKDQCNYINTNCEEVEVEKGCKMENNECKGENENNKCNLIDYYISGSKSIKVCKKVIIDEGCEITTSDICQAKSDISQTASCSYENYKTHCKKNNYPCTHFSDDQCGGLKGINEEDKEQCIKFSSTCSLVEIDEYCSVDETDKTCKKRGTFDVNIYKCDMDSSNTKCIRKTICSTRKADSCTVNKDNCYKIYPYSECQLVTVDEKCEIKNEDCSAKDDKFDKCTFNDDYTRCQYEEKKCEEILSSNDCSHYKSSNGKTCTKVDYSQYCKEVTIKTPCKINTSGQCVRDGEEVANQFCSFNLDKDKDVCQLYEKDNECEIDKSNLKCYDISTATVSNQYCAFDTTNTKCKLRDVTECENYGKIGTRCEADTKLKSANKKCSLSNSVCKEYEIVSPCTVIEGVCTKDGTKTNNLGTNMECRFDNILEKKCMPKDITKCETYYNPADCYIKDHIILADKKQCIYTYGNNCKEITINDKCEVNSNTHNCVKKDGATLDEKKEYCGFDDETNKNSCTNIRKKCTEYKDNSCNDLEKCSFYFNQCYETDDICSFDENGNTKVRPNKELKQTEKCAFIEENDKWIYKKVDKQCNDYTDGDNDKCTNIPKTSENQCYKFLNENNCRLVTLKGNCKVIKDGNEDKCVVDDSKTLGENEICAFTDNSKTECRKREKLCSDLAKSECDNFDLALKQCYKLSSTTNCKEIQVDSQCKIDEDKNCVNKGCSFNEDKDKCSYKNNGSLVELKNFVLLLLFFMF